LYTKKIYFAGGSFHELQEVFSRIEGVSGVTAGYINSDIQAPTYDEVMTGSSGAAMGVEVLFDPKRIDLSSLMDILFAVINPYVKDKQGDCEGPMYRSGVYDPSAEDEPMVEYHMNFIRNRKKIPAVTGSQLTLNDPNSDPEGIRQCYAEAKRLQNFTPAEEEQQNYLKKHPETNTNIDFALLKKLNIIR
jgi:methionine-S-sulfoxide reductase